LTTQGSILMSASFSMVTLSVGSVAGHGLLDRNLALEKENAALRGALEDADRRIEGIRSQDALVYESTISSVRAAKKAATANVRILKRQHTRMQAKLDVALEARAVAERRADEAEAVGRVDRARAAAAAALATAAETYALELDARLSKVEVQRDRARAEGRELRDLASRHMPEVAPSKALRDLELLAADLAAAKADAGRDRDYRVAVACSGLRTFEASATGFGDRLGQRLLAEARSLRQDPDCLALVDDPIAADVSRY